jgi:hypothetical protein
MKKKRINLMKKLNRLYKRLETDLYGCLEVTTNPFDNVENASSAFQVLRIQPEENKDEEQEVIQDLTDNKEVCYICYEECETVLNTCPHFCHKKCRANSLNHGRLKCGICNVPLRNESPEQTENREYKRTMKDILNLLKDERYTLNCLTDIKSFLESAEH